MIDNHNPSLLLSTGYDLDLNEQHENNKITIIYNNYLKDIRTELLEEDDVKIDNQNNEIIYVMAEVEGIPSQIMIDTGANVSVKMCIRDRYTV